MRDIGEVIDRLLAVIPEDETALRAFLRREKGDAAYRAPEMMGISWASVQSMLQHSIPKPTLDWQKQALAIWNDTGAS